MTTVDTIFQNHQAQVYAWAYRLVQNHHDALDLTQEVYLRWWRACGATDKPRQPIPWLRRVTINLSLDFLRAGRRTPQLSLSPDTADPSETMPAERRETARDVAAALDTLSEQQRSVVIAKVYEGLTFSAIAEQMERSIPTVKTHYLRALQNLRKRLTPEDYLEGTHK